jgi:hypothetical protein
MASVFHHRKMCNPGSDSTTDYATHLRHFNRNTAQVYCVRIFLWRYPVPFPTGTKIQNEISISFLYSLEMKAAGQLSRYSDWAME